MKIKFLYITIISALSLIGCINYKAGNRVTLDYPLDTRLSYSILRMYLDTLTNMENYKVPVKWKQYNKLLDINPEDTWRIYLKNNPEEMYLLQINGTLIIADVYNPLIINNDWIAEEKRMPKADKERVIKRTKEDILDKIEQLAKRGGCPDSVLYFKTKYVDGKWTIAPKWPNL